MKRNLFIKLFAPALMVAGSGFLSSCSSVDDGSYVPFTFAPRNQVRIFG